MASADVGEATSDLLELLDEVDRRGVLPRVRELRVGNASIQLQTEPQRAPAQPAARELTPTEQEEAREQVLFGSSG